LVLLKKETGNRSGGEHRAEEKIRALFLSSFRGGARRGKRDRVCGAFWGVFYVLDVAGRRRDLFNNTIIIIIIIIIITTQEPP
jgi:hypothetical protein